ALDDALEPDGLEPREHPREDAIEEEFEDSEVQAVEVRGHLVDVAARHLDHLAPRHAALGGKPPREPNQLGVAQDHLAHDAARQQRRPEHHPLLAIEDDLQHTREPAGEAVLALPAVLLDEAVQADLPSEGELRLAGVPQVREEPLRLARRLLNAVEQRRKPRFALVEPGAAKDRDGYE